MPETQNTRKAPCKRLSRIPQLMVRRHAGNPKHHDDAFLERLLATREGLRAGTRRDLVPAAVAITGTSL